MLPGTSVGEDAQASPEGSAQGGWPMQELAKPITVVGGSSVQSSGSHLGVLWLLAGGGGAVAAASRR